MPVVYLLVYFSLELPQLFFFFSEELPQLMHTKKLQFMYKMTKTH